MYCDKKKIFSHRNNVSETSEFPTFAKLKQYYHTHFKVPKRSKVSKRNF